MNVNNKQPSEEMCQQFKAKPEDFRFVTTDGGTTQTDCAHCCFKPPKDTICDYEDSRCTWSDRDDNKAGYWVLVEKPTGLTDLTIEEAEAKIADLQRHVEMLKTKAPEVGELYKHDRTGCVYMVVQDSHDYKKLLLFCVKEYSEKASGVSNQYWSRKGTFGRARKEFSLIGHVRDLLCTAQ